MWLPPSIGASISRQKCEFITSADKKCLSVLQTVIWVEAWPRVLARFCRA